MNRQKDIAKVTANGKFSDILAETLGIIKLVYEGIRENNLEAADEFKRQVQASMLDPKSPIFQIEEPLAE
jgi:hypothetical protein